MPNEGRTLAKDDRRAWFVVAGLLGCLACGAPQSPVAPTLTAALTPGFTPPIPAPVPPPSGLPPLAACGTEPNYVQELDSLQHIVVLYRRERFPLRVSIAGDPDTQSYLEAIKMGLMVWSAATGGTIGTVDIGIDAKEADLTVRVGTHPIYDCRVDMWHGIFADAENPSRRILRGGTIYICPENFRATPSDVLRVANVVGHEMGHALGIAGHSTDAGDLMYENDVLGSAPADSYPWVSKRDLNTLGTAYCN